MTVIVIAGLCTTNPALAQGTEGYAADMRAGRAAYKAADMATAEKHFSSAVGQAETEKQKSAAHYALGVVSQKLNKLPEAKKHAEQAVAANPGDAAAKGLLDEVNAPPPPAAKGAKKSAGKAGAAKSDGAKAGPTKTSLNKPLQPGAAKTASSPADGAAPAAGGETPKSDAGKADAAKPPAKAKKSATKPAVGATGAEKASAPAAAPTPPAMPADAQTPAAPPPAAPPGKSGGLSDELAPATAGPLSATVKVAVAPVQQPGSLNANSTQEGRPPGPLGDAMPKPPEPQTPPQDLEPRPPEPRQQTSAALSQVGQYQQPQSPQPVQAQLSTGSLIPSAAASSPPVRTPSPQAVVPQPQASVPQPPFAVLPARARYVETACEPDYRRNDLSTARAFEVTRSAEQAQILGLVLACAKDAKGGLEPRMLLDSADALTDRIPLQPSDGTWSFQPKAAVRATRIRLDAHTLTLLPSPAEVALLRRKLADSPAQLEAMTPSDRTRLEQIISGEGYPEFRAVQPADGLDKAFEQAANVVGR